jgi:hypothetical protein
VLDILDSDNISDGPLSTIDVRGHAVKDGAKDK